MRYLLLLSLIASTACSHLRPIPEKGCLKEPPPPLESVQAEPCEGYAACIDHDNFAALVRNIMKWEGYKNMAWELCGVPPETKKPTAPESPM